MTPQEALQAAVDRFTEIADECEAVGQYSSATQLGDTTSENMCQKGCYSGD